MARFPLLALVSAFSACVATHASAQARPLTVERRGPPVLAARAGGHATLVFRITNNSDSTRTIAGHLTLPPTWRLIVPEGTLSLAPRASDLQLLQIALPLGTLAGRYALRYAVAINERREVDSVVVEVARHQQVTVTAEDPPRFTIAGATYRTSFAVRNDGNVPVDLLLGIKSSDKFPARIDSGRTTLHIAPGTEESVGVSVLTNADLSHRLIHRVQLGVSAAAGTDSLRVNGVSTVEIIARKQDSPGRFRSVPAQLALRRDAEDGTLSLELLGNGLVNEDGATRVSFLARSPSSRASLFAEPDEYWLQLAAPRYGVRVGDQGYFGSRINDAGFPTVGAAAHVAVGALRVGAYGERDRRGYNYTQGQQYGGSLDLSVGPGDSIGVGYFMRQGLGAGNVLSGRATLTPAPLFALTSEYGKGIGSVKGDAYIVSLIGRAERYTYSAQRQWADTGFAGNWRGTAYTSAYGTLRPPGPFDVTGSLSDLTSEQILGIAYSRPARQQIADAGFSVFEAAFGANYRYARQNGFSLFSGPDARRYAQSVRVNLGLPYVRAFSLRGEMEHGRTINDASPDDPLPFRRWTLRAGASRFGQSLVLSVERMQGTPVYSDVPLDQIAGSVSTRIQIAGATTLNLGWNGNRYRGTSIGSYSLFDIGIGKQFSAGQRLGYRSRAYAAGNQLAPLYRRSVQQFEYAMPLGVPIGFSNDAGTVRVRLVDDQTRRPVADVLLRLGDQARITDEDGRADFVGLSAQTYYLEVDRSKIGRGRVITPAMPLPIILRTNEKRELDLRLVGGAAVRGQVRMLRAQPRRLGEADALVDAGPLSGVPILITCGADTLRTITDAGGSFRMIDLRPGHWVVEVSAADSTAHGKLERNRIEVDLRPGDSRDVEFRVVPVAAPVKFVAEAELPTRVTAPLATAGETKPRSARVRSRPAGWPVRGEKPDETSHHFTFSRRDGGLIAIARAMYGDASLWPKIWLANLDRIDHPDVVPAGIRLRVPDKAPLTARERAALHAYEASKR